MAEAAYQGRIYRKKCQKFCSGRKKNVDWLNGTGKVVSSGYLVVQDNLVGVAHADIPDGDVGILHTVGVFSLPKEAEALTPRQTGVFQSRCSPTGNEIR